jgi:putative transposase
MAIEHPDQEPAVSAAVEISDDQLVAMLVDRARGNDLKLTGEGGLLQQLTKRVLESALEGENTGHEARQGLEQAGEHPQRPPREDGDH